MNRAADAFALCFLHFALIVSAYGQATTYADSASIIVLLNKASALAENSPLRSARLYEQVYHYSKKISFARGISKSCNQLGWFYQNESKYDSAIYYYKEASLNAIKAKLLEEEIVALTGIGESFMRQHKGDSSRHYLNQLLEKSKKMGQIGQEAGAYNSLANSFLNENKFEDALANFIRSAELYDSIHDQTGLSKALSNIGNIEYRLGHLEKALEYTNRSIVMAAASNHKSGIAYGKKLLGWIYRKQGNLTEALAAYDSAQTVYAQLGAKRDVAEVTLSIANAYYDLQDYKKATNYYKQSLRANQEINYQPFIPYNYSGLAYCYYTVKDFRLALLYTDSLVVSAKPINAYLLLDAYDLKSSIYEAQGDYKNALINQRLYVTHKDSLTQIENRQAMAEAESKFQTNLKQNEIDRLNQEQELKEIKINKYRTTQIAIGSALLLVIVIAILVINRFRIISRATRQIEMERMRNLIARDLHDDIGSALSSINIVSRLAPKDPQPEIMLKNFQRISDQSSRVMESMSDIVWSINPENDTIQKVVVKMREFAAEILEPKNIQLQFEKYDFPLLTLNSEQRKNIFLVFKEAINNAAKYSECSKVSVELHIDNKELVLKIQDNGKGFDARTIKTGNGMRNMKARALDLNGRLEISSATGQGTTIQLKFDLT